jgi:lysyl-tRNA synthetase, class II
LTDPVEQLHRFLSQRKAQAARNGAAKGYEDNPLDLDFIKAIGCGMPPTGGVGLGIDRLIMILTDAPSIRDIIPFPMIKLRPAASEP